MPALSQSLSSYDLGHLHIVAGLWGIELVENAPEAAVEELCASILDRDLFAEVLEALRPEARAALEAMLDKNGRIPWAEFTRRFGEIREMGAGKRDREKPHLAPISIAETLFYRALIARAFFNTAGGPQEFAYIPDDFYKLMSHTGTPSPPAAPAVRPGASRTTQDRGDGGQAEPQGKREEESSSAGIYASTDEPLGRPASPGEKAFPLPASDFILDDATTLLAALRLGMEPPETTIPRHVLEAFLRAAKVIIKSGPKPDKVKAFLEAPRQEALQMLADSWMKSEAFNELRQLPGLVFEGEWHNQPLVTREFLINLLDAVPEGKWWSLPAFIRDVKARYADFQRLAGDYDSWFIKRAADGEYLRGFAYWDQVDGALLKYFITNILFWLGQVDLASPEEGAEITSFLLSSSMAGKDEKGKITASSSGRITVERTAPRAIRYQVARFCAWEEPKTDEYRYILTPSSLRKAAEQGLKVEHLLSLLAKYTPGGVPPVLSKALKRWEGYGTEARLQTQVVLRVSRPEVLEELRRSKAARFLGELLGPTTVVVKEGAQPKVMAALAELGLLADADK